MQPKFLWLSIMLAASSANVYAAGFGLIDNSVANMGNAYAGAAAPLAQKMLQPSGLIPLVWQS